MDEKVRKFFQSVLTSEGEVISPQSAISTESSKPEKATRLKVTAEDKVSPQAESKEAPVEPQAKHKKLKVVELDS